MRVVAEEQDAARNLDLSQVKNTRDGPASRLWTRNWLRLTISRNDMAD